MQTSKKPLASQHKQARIVVLISGNGSNLQAIIDACKSSTASPNLACDAQTHASSAISINASIAAVISNRPNVYGLTRAQQAGIPAITLDHKSFASRELFDQALAELIDSHQPTVVVLAGFMRILTSDFVAKFEGRLLNIHPSLLPKYPGLNTHQRAIEAGDVYAGVTVHFVTAELDGGPAIIQAQVAIKQNDTAADLAQRVLVEEHKIYPQAISWLADGRLSLTDGKAKLDNEQLLSQSIPAN